VPYLSIINFWNYQNADVWKKSRTHPPWFKHYVHRDRELDALPVEARLLWVELLAAATRHNNILGLGPLPPGHGLSEAEAKLRESERNLSWICGEVRMEPETVAEMLPLLIKGGWLSQTATPRRSRKPSRKNLEGPREQDVDVDREEDEDGEQEQEHGSSNVSAKERRTSLDPNYEDADIEIDWGHTNGRDVERDDDGLPYIIANIEKL
jgi:hypothetical protein